MPIGYCHECIFWLTMNPESKPEWGFCHRYPPLVCGPEAYHPKTWRLNLCGECRKEDRCSI